jgi:predicted RNA-binding protein with PIN domain
MDSQEKIEDERLKLIHFVERLQPQGSSKNEVTIVFDGRPGLFSWQGAGGIKVLFSMEQSADDVIRRLVAEANNKKNIVVVSNDKELFLATRAQGAKIVNVQKFLAQPHPSTKGVRQDQGKEKEPSKYIPKTLEFKINAEMEDIWLKKKPKER